MGSHDLYIAIDLKSFYASVECQDRKLDPLTTNLVVADAQRTEKTICLAVSPSLKAYGIGGRARLFEVVQRVREVNAQRLATLRAHPELRNSAPPTYPRYEPGQEDLPGKDLQAYRPLPGSSFDLSTFHDSVVQAYPNAELDFLIAKPRMALYLSYSTQIYEVYLKYFAAEDIHVYSIDEVFIDATKYLRTYQMEGTELASKIVTDVYQTTGITATAGIGTNLYLAKVAMDILAKHEQPDERGVRIAVLDEDSYKQRLWDHTPLTDFWRIGRGYARKLEAHGMRTMGDIARCSLGTASQRRNEELLFRLFGKNAELLIDHAWGYEPVTMEEIKAYRPETKSTVAGQVLHTPYEFDDARLVAWEMADQLALDLTAARVETDKLTLTIGYDRLTLTDPRSRDVYDGEVTEDRYGRIVPKHAHGTTTLKDSTASSHRLTEAVLDLFDRIVDPGLLVRKITISADDLMSEEEAFDRRTYGQKRLFDDEAETVNAEQLSRERQLQDAMLDIREKFGKNAILKAPSLKEHATAQQRNNQIGGHSA